MVVDTEKVKKIIDDFSYKKTGKHIVNDIYSMAIAKGVKNIVIDASEKNDIVSNNDFEFKYDQNELVLLVPKELREQIAFSVEYIFSKFEVLEKAIANLQEQFDIDRFSKIKSAIDELENVQTEGLEKRKGILENHISNVSDSLNSIMGNIEKVVKTINAIPKERRKRLKFSIQKKSSIQEILKDVQLGREEVEMLVLGTQVCAEMNLVIGCKEPAEKIIKKSIAFLDDKYKSGDFKRVEQWNEAKDGYWEQEIENNIIKLESYITEIEEMDDKITIKI
ncbi:hypothetical protein KQI69_04995 [Eubacterium sp. MSJ-13]|uniref:hypothetical protein n=1 Tax=Eubacterium sp. MSJ-13 TaxID=2841513 RepID=UPI001C10B415|nr:hypothetical protein [Eubacterium sp. MSJ-13]MBU5478556.1 hypothetical protein [Eubacterium sp. MSJ-13]